MLSSDRNPTNYPAFVKVFFFQIASIEQTQSVDIGGMGRGETPHHEYIKYTFGAPKDLLYWMEDGCSRQTCCLKANQKQTQIFL